MSFQSSLVTLLLLAVPSATAAAQQVPWGPGEPPPPAGVVRIGQTLADLDSTLGTPTTVSFPRPGRESRLYQERGISLIADSSGGVGWVLLFTRAAGDIGGVRVGDAREAAERRFGKPTIGRGESKAYLAGDWYLVVQLDPMTEFVHALAIGREEFYPADQFGVLGTLKRVVLDLYHAADAVGLLGIISFANYFLWRKYKYWVPRYVHLLALVAFGVICWLNWLWIQVGGELTVRRVIIILFFPAIVYFFFVGAGGVRAAYARRKGGGNRPSAGGEAHGNR
jgi:hypothetical protein